MLDNAQLEIRATRYGCQILSGPLALEPAITGRGALSPLNAIVKSLPFCSANAIKKVLVQAAESRVKLLRESSQAALGIIRNAPGVVAQSDEGRKK